MYDFVVKGKILTHKSGKVTMFFCKFIHQIANPLEIVLQMKIGYIETQNKMYMSLV